MGELKDTPEARELDKKRRQGLKDIISQAHGYKDRADEMEHLKHLNNFILGEC